MADLNSSDLANAVSAQQAAAQDASAHVRLIAGPGSGKSRTIMLRLEHLISQGAAPDSIYVISFTRASAFDLRTRVVERFKSKGLTVAGDELAENVTTMHSLALKLLAGANLLSGIFPAHPVILDRWQQENIFDEEFSQTAGVTPTRAREVRAAYDAHWQTLASLNLVGGGDPPTPSEQNAFTSYYPTAKTLYSCLLPGEVVRSCVDEIKQGSITTSHLPNMKHLIVDEYQDLNKCDQEFVDELAKFGARVFIAGDDDQSVYSFRHAAPDGIVDYISTHPEAVSHNLQHCFRCASSILSTAQTLIGHNPGRIAKTHVSIYSNSTPTVDGDFQIWRCPTGVEEAKWIAESCRDLLSAGIEPTQVLILLRSHRTQGKVIYDALSAASVQFEPARADSLLEESMPRLVHSLLEIVKDPSDKYVHYRVVLGLLHGVGKGTCTGIAQRTVGANLNFRDLFYSSPSSHVFTGNQRSAIKRVASIISSVKSWSVDDTLSSRALSIESIGSDAFDKDSQSGKATLEVWNELVETLPAEMTLDELYAYLDSDTEAGRYQVMDSVTRRLGTTSGPQENKATNAVRVLTMHGSKGLEGQVVFIPGVEQGIIPSPQTLGAAGLINEERRLLYTAITRAKASCILSLASIRVGNQAYLLSGQSVTGQTRSPFIPEIGSPTVQRTTGLSAIEIASILEDVSNL